MIRFSYADIQKLIDDDLPYFDLTTSIQNISVAATATIFTREDITLSCSSLARMVASEFSLEFKAFYKDGDKAFKNSNICQISGDYQTLASVYKIIQIALEWACGIATTTNNMLNLLRDSNPNAQILTTRKTLPFAKKLCLKAVLDGGGQIHRLSLSDSVIFFDHHIKAGGGFEAFCKKIPLYKQTLIEKKIIAECENAKSAKMLLKAGIDGIQCDKFSLKELKEVYEYKNSNFKNTFVIAAGGINLSNIAEFGKFCDAVVTSAPYHAKPSDLGVKIDITN